MNAAHWPNPGCRLSAIEGVFSGRASRTRGLKTTLAVFAPGLGNNSFQTQHRKLCRFDLRDGCGSAFTSIAGNKLSRPEYRYVNISLFWSQKYLAV